MRKSYIGCCFVYVSILNSLSGSEIKVPGPKCSVEDLKCLGEIIKYVFKEYLAVGVKELDVQPIDPISHTLIEEQLSDFKYSLIDSIAKGLKDMVLNDITVLKGRSMHFDFTVPYFEMRGQFKVSGKLLNLPVDEEGSYFFNGTNLHMVVDVKKEFVENEGKTYLQLTNRKASSELLGSAYFDLQLPSGEPITLPFDLQKLLNENPKAVAKLWSPKVTLANVNKVFDEYNKLLLHIPVSDFVEGDIY